MELTIPAAVAQAAREFGDAEALAEPGGARLSYGELDERVAASEKLGRKDWLDL